MNSNELPRISRQLLGLLPHARQVLPGATHDPRPALR